MSDLASPTYCINHPKIETSLRCNRCGQPICPKCAVHTPTGYRCKDCVKTQQKIFVTARWYDYVLGFLTGSLLSLLASIVVFLVSVVTGFFVWILLVAGVSSMAIGIAEVLRFVTRRHRSKALFITIIVSLFMGALPVILFELLTLNIWSLLFEAAYLIIAIPIIYHRLSGMHIIRS